MNVKDHESKNGWLMKIADAEEPQQKFTSCIRE